MRATSPFMALAKPIDLSFKELNVLSDLEGEDNASELKPRTRDTSTINLSNNHIDSIVDLPRIVSKLIPNPLAIAWIDLSFNALGRIQDVIVLT